MFKKRWIWIGCLVALAIVAASCSESVEGPGGETAGSVPDTIACEVFYRSSPGQPFDGSTLTLSTDGERQTLDFADLRFEAVTVADVGEGKSLAIAVTDLETNREMSRALYQFDRQQGVADQFIGGHGFTGLAYVFHPTSSGEIQYFCQANPQG